MREIKFSYIQQHDETGRFTESVLTLPQIESLTAGIVYKGYSLVARRQFTGLCDINGKEIYEGDILHNNQGDPDCVVIFDRGRFGAYTSDGWIDLIDLGENEGAINEEVLGNIYEHPHLLEAQ